MVSPGVHGAVLEISNTPPQIDLSYNPSTPGAQQTVTFDASGSSDSDGYIVSYSWDWDNDGDYDASGETATHTWNSPGDYTIKLRVTDNEGCGAIKWETISVVAAPDADFEYTPSESSFLDTIQFQDRSSMIGGGAYISSWHWNFGDGSTSADENPSHKYPRDKPTTYFVTLTVTASNGKQDSVTKQLYVDMPRGTVITGGGYLSVSPGGKDHACIYLGNGRAVQADPDVGNWTDQQTLDFTAAKTVPKNLTKMLQLEKEVNSDDGIRSEVNVVSLGYLNRWYEPVRYCIPQELSSYSDKNKSIIMKAAGDWAENKTGQKFDYVSYWINDTKQVDENDIDGEADKNHGNKYYCAELTWAAYKTQGIKLDDGEEDKVKPQEVQNNVDVFRNIYDGEYYDGDTSDSSGDSTNDSDTDNSNKILIKDLKKAAKVE